MKNDKNNKSRPRLRKKVGQSNDSTKLDVDYKDFEFVDVVIRGSEKGHFRNMVGSSDD